jgi:lipopolysaccharide transport system permease protein
MNEKEFDLIIRHDKKLDKAIKEVWVYRDLFYFLAWRDFKVRYKQTIIGSLWAFLRPLLTMIVFTVIFGKIAGLPSQGETPYAIMVFVGMLPWYFFASSFQEGSNALIANSNMISKVYFPRIIVPVSSLFVNLIDFLISFTILALLMLYYQFMPSINILMLPLFLLLAATFTVATILWMSALNVKYRDIRYLVPFVVQFGLYVSPVGFASEVVANQWRFLYSLNPMVGVIDGFRWCILGENVNFYWPGFSLSIVITLFLLFTGYLYFTKTERKFADII